MPAGFISESWPASNRNGGRLHVGKPGRNKSESAAAAHFIDKARRIADSFEMASATQAGRISSPRHVFRY